MQAETTIGYGPPATRAMASNRNSYPSRLGGGFLAILALGLAGCATGGDDNSPSMGKVPPKPDPNIAAKLPPQIRAQMTGAKPGADAAAMSKMKHGTTSP